MKQAASWTSIWLPFAMSKAQSSSGHRVLSAGIPSKQELNQPPLKLGAESCSCTALARTNELFCSSSTSRASPAPAELGTLRWSVHLFALFNRHQHLAELLHVFRISKIFLHVLLTAYTYRNPQASFPSVPMDSSPLLSIGIWALTYIPSSRRAYTNLQLSPFHLKGGKRLI